MKKLLKKLRSNAGETLVEVMAAILVFTFASILLFSMVSAASDINRTVKESDQSIATELVTAEKKSKTDRVTGYTVSVKISGAVVSSDSVNLYRKDADSLYSYSLANNTLN